jgi:hypothetical protein
LAALSLYAMRCDGLTRGSGRLGLSAPLGASMTIHQTGGPVPGAAGYSPRNDSMPTVSPGCFAISRTASSTPGMNDARSKESWRRVSV